MVSIGDASGEKLISLGTQAWNIADGFTKIKILRLLIELDVHETIAMFGRKDMEEYVDFEDISLKRKEALNRMIFSLKQLIGNCKFSIEKKDQMAMEGFILRINNVEKVIGGIMFTYNNDVTKEVEYRINEPHFMVCFDILKDIKDEINIPINKAGLIFRKSEDVDLDAIMKNIIEGG
jgi:hypothetical protein